MDAKNAVLLGKLIVPSALMVISIVRDVQAVSRKGIAPIVVMVKII